MKRRKIRKIKRTSVKLSAFILAAASLVIICIFAGKSSVNASETAETYYTSICVESGETLSEIAEKYGVSVKELKKINNLESDTINAGESLIVSYTR